MWLTPLEEGYNLVNLGEFYKSPFRWATQAVRSMSSVYHHGISSSLPWLSSSINRPVTLENLVHVYLKCHCVRWHKTYMTFTGTFPAIWMFSLQSEWWRLFSVHYKQDFGLYHQFVSTMNGRLQSDKLSHWLFSNLAGLSCFEIRKHVIYSPALAAATIESRPFNTPLCSV